MSNNPILELLQAGEQLAFLPEQIDALAYPDAVSKYGLAFRTKQEHKTFQHIFHHLSLQSESDGIPMIPVRDILVELLKQKKASNQAITEKDVASYIKACRSVKPSPHLVVRELHGAVLRRHAEPFKFGDFTIYQWALHKDHLQKLAGPPDKTNWPRDDYKYLIGCTVEARNVNQARELADEQFAKFENVIRFLVGSFKSIHDVTVSAPHRISIGSSFVFHADYNAVRTSTDGFVQDLMLDDPRFQDPMRGYDKLLAFLHTPKSKLQGKIVRSLDWIGQALYDQNRTSAMVKAATALEVLLSYREAGPVTPGIMAQISETLAFLIADSPEAAVRLEKEARDLYEIRSKIVHFGKDKVSQDELTAMARLVTHAILVLLTHPEYSNCQTMEEIAGKLKLRKYATTRMPADSTADTAGPSKHDED